MTAQKRTSQSVSKWLTQGENNARQPLKQTLAFGASFGSVFDQKARGNLKKTLTAANYLYNPALITAIVRRKKDDIKKIIDPTRRFHDDTYVPAATLQESQFEALESFYGKRLLENPFMLALKICDSPNTETTDDNSSTRYDVLHVLAENFDACVADAKQKGHKIPDLAEILKYAQSFDDEFALGVFIHGLSDENKACAAEILEPQKVLSRAAAPAA